MNTKNETNIAYKGTRVEAGLADLWHVHKDHLKYGAITATRVDFNGRSRAKIMEKIEEKSELYAPYRQTEPQQATYQACLAWIEDNIS